ncbi:hypothetical protein ACIA59_23805 [Micromonospora haikouensis]|uniref:hypothetical protein n=1 Tax=Micromonospora haikouensis TaxID=686309 RepID=UPI0037B66F49
MTAPAQPGNDDHETSSDEIVLVAIPRAHLSRLAALLAELDAEIVEPGRVASRTVAPPVPAAELSPPLPQDWPVEDLRRFAAGRSASHRTIVAVLDVLATEPDRPFAMAELTQRTGLTRSKIVGALAGLTRLVKAHYDYARFGLPLTRIIEQPEGTPKVFSYTLSARQALRWRDARM